MEVTSSTVTSRVTDGDTNLACNSINAMSREQDQLKAPILCIHLSKYCLLCAYHLKQWSGQDTLGIYLSQMPRLRCGQDE